MRKSEFRNLATLFLLTSLTTMTGRMTVAQQASAPPPHTLI